MDYILVYFHYGLKSSNKPSLKWLREAYGEFDRKYDPKRFWVLIGCRLTYVLFFQADGVPPSTTSSTDKPSKNDQISSLKSIVSIIAVMDISALRLHQLKQTRHDMKTKI